MNCLYTYCTVKEKVDGSLWRQISSEWWWLEAIFSIFPYSHMINCATVSLIFAQTVKSQCSPLYPPPCILMGMMPVHTHAHSPWSQQKTGIRNRNHSVFSLITSMERSFFVISQRFDLIFLIQHSDWWHTCDQCTSSFFFSQWNACADGNSNVS